ncbi:MAG: PhzF family phenazine biosynthesis protein [Holosporales bacterium]|jgi:PhzF family phenazine biosynthesis protein|nr:PhzF family phenazine biosynthesis protein [Holosporales bacterium]
MATDFWIVDTFSSDSFQGIPSAIFFVNNFDNEKLLQDVAMEINTPETIFIKELENGDFESMCFTPKVKGLYFGNGLFAAAKAINEKMGKKEFNIISGIRIFSTSLCDSGEVKIRFSTVVLDKVTMPVNLDSALNDEIIVSIAESKDDLIVEIRSPKRLVNLAPNMDILSGMRYNSFIITADTHYETDVAYDFCVKVFAPKLGVFSDIITPISNAKLAAYWSRRMEKVNLVGSRASLCNGGLANIKHEKEFTYVSGNCVISTRGTMLAF